MIKRFQTLDLLILLIELVGEILDVRLPLLNLYVRVNLQPGSILMLTDLFLKLLRLLLLLLELFLGDGGEVGQAADFNLVAHVLSVALRKHLHGLHELVVDRNFVAQRLAIAIVQSIDFLSLIL